MGANVIALESVVIRKHMLNANVPLKRLGTRLVGHVTAGAGTQVGQGWDARRAVGLNAAIGEESCSRAASLRTAGLGTTSTIHGGRGLWRQRQKTEIIKQKIDSPAKTARD